MSRQIPLSPPNIESLAQQYGTPFHLYDEAGIRETAKGLNQVFDWVKGANGAAYVNYYAVKANPNPHILSILAEEGMGADASSAPEITLASVVGLGRGDIMFTANHTKPGEYKRAHDAGAFLNFDDEGELEKAVKELDGKTPDTVSFRYNPGNKKSEGVNAIIGTPIDGKFGVPDDGMEAAYIKAKALGVEHFGMHTMVASNELDAWQHVATARLVFGKIAELSQKLGITFEFANLGGGLGIPYHPEEPVVDYAILREGTQQAHQELIIDNGLPALQVMTENGRHVTGPHGWLIARVVDVKDGYHLDVGVDATTAADLPRPAAYDAYHEISLVSPHPTGEMAVQRVVGSLCEDNDYLTGAKTKTRLLPVLHEGDLLAIGDDGAHTRAMASNYNAKLRAGELLLKQDGSVVRIRRPETEDDLFATLDYPGLT